MRLKNYLVKRAKYRAERYRQSSKMLSIADECTIIEIKPASEYGYAIESNMYKK